MNVLWTVESVVNNSGKISAHKVGEFETKREAVNAMMMARQPKTQIDRVGRHYTVTAKKDK